jgi:hypothetical protein
MKNRTEKTNADEKKTVGEHAAGLVKDGMVVGLGTGSTTAYAIAALGRRVKQGLTIQGIATSYQSEMMAIDCNIPLTMLAQEPTSMQSKEEEQPIPMRKLLPVLPGNLLYLWTTQSLLMF